MNPIKGTIIYIFSETLVLSGFINHRFFWGVFFMNELQLVLLIFAVVVIGGLYFFSKIRQNKTQDAQTHATSGTLEDENIEKMVSSNDSKKTSNSVRDQTDPDLLQVPENQASFAFDDEFNTSTTKSDALNEPSVDLFDGDAQKIQDINSVREPNDINEPTMGEMPSEQVDSLNKQGKNHHILEVDELFTVSEMGGAGSANDPPKTNFGIPQHNAPAANQTPSKSQGEHQVFALLVLSTGSSGQEFSMDAVNHALLGVGLKFAKNQIYVTVDSQGSEIIRVANIIEPGTFPTENLASYKTPGVALILELPSSVRAPAAMHDLIMMARKISQRLKGRLYNMERQLIKESDLQAMRDAAVNYESDPL